MEKKTRFKLNFIQSHIAKATDRKKNSRRFKRLFLPNDSEKQLVIYKYFSPICSHRVVGDLVFLDSLCNIDDFVPLSSLWKSFKHITLVEQSGNFTICNKLDSDDYSPNLNFLLERLMSLGNSYPYNLALMISKLNRMFSSLPLSKDETKMNCVKQTENSNFLQQYLEKNSNFPIIMYHYKSHPQLGMANTKIAVNNVLKDITFQDDIRIFEESIFVCPANEYFDYMIKHLEACFETPKDEYMLLFVNTRQGVKRMFAKGENFSLGDETIVVITFPKAAQTLDVQQLYERDIEPIKKLNSKKLTIPESESTGSEQNLIMLKEKKNRKKTTIKSFRDWENLIKQYFDPKENFNEQRRCHYRTIEENNNNN